MTNDLWHGVALVVSVTVPLFLQACGGSDASTSTETEKTSPASPARDGGASEGDGDSRVAADASSDAPSNAADPGACVADPTKNYACEGAPLPRPSPNYFVCTAPAVLGAACTQVGTFGSPGGTVRTFWCCE